MMKIRAVALCLAIACVFGGASAQDNVATDQRGQLTTQDNVATDQRDQLTPQDNVVIGELEQYRPPAQYFLPPIRVARFGFPRQTEALFADVDGAPGAEIIFIRRGGGPIPRTQDRITVYKLVLTPTPRLRRLGNEHVSNAYWQDEAAFLTGDIDGDQRGDILVFDAQGLITGQGTPESGYVQFGRWDQRGDPFTYNSGWRAASHTRAVGKVNRDDTDDLVGFGDPGVWLAPTHGRQGSPVSFDAPQLLLAQFGNDRGWSNDRHVRTLGDIDGDGLADVVGFGEDGVLIARSNGEGFDPPRFVLEHLGVRQGWSGATRLAQRAEQVRPTDRRVLDINGDGAADLVGFNGSMSIALSTRTTFTAPSVFFRDYFAGHPAVQTPRGNGRTIYTTLHPLLGDINGDRLPDLVWVNSLGMMQRALNNRGSFEFDGWNRLDAPVTRAGMPALADLNGDGLQDLIRFDGLIGMNVWLSALGPGPPPPPPPTITRITDPTGAHRHVYVQWNDTYSNETGFLVGVRVCGGGRCALSTLDLHDNFSEGDTIPPPVWPAYAFERVDRNVRESIYHVGGRDYVVCAIVIAATADGLSRPSPEVCRFTPNGA